MVGPPMSGGFSLRAYPAAMDPASAAIAADCCDDFWPSTASLACAAAAAAASAAACAAHRTAPYRAWLDASEAPTGARNARAEANEPWPEMPAEPSCRHRCRLGGAFAPRPSAGSTPGPRQRRADDDPAAAPQAGPAFRLGPPSLSASRHPRQPNPPGAAPPPTVRGSPLPPSAGSAPSVLSDCTHHDLTRVSTAAGAPLSSRALRCELEMVAPPGATVGRAARGGWINTSQQWGV
eukprot:scaffold128_cov118-Isochrysis_galbana.AAC.2